MLVVLVVLLLLLLLLLSWAATSSRCSNARRLKVLTGDRYRARDELDSGEMDWPSSEEGGLSEGVRWLRWL